MMFKAGFLIIGFQKIHSSTSDFAIQDWWASTGVRMVRHPPENFVITSAP